MLDITLKELRDQEYANVETTCNEIAEKLSERVEIRPYTVFAAAYLSYLVADNELENEEKLLDYIEKELPLDQLLFVKESVENSWSVVMKIGNLYTKERLLATVLWMPMSDRRMGYQQETPESIINLAIKILSINNEKVADFCCGKGAFLAKALEEDEKSEYYGIEIETHCKEIANIRLALASKNGSIELGNVFELDKNKKFDKIFSDYPWHIFTKNTWISEEKLQEFKTFIPEIKKIVRADWLFILNTIQHLNDNGKAVVMTTNGTMWNLGTDKKIREKFVEMGMIEAVISLPVNLYSATSIPTSMMVFSRGNKKVRMIDASSMASVGRRQNILSEETVEQIIRMLTEDCDNAKSVTCEEIAKENYAINPARFLHTEPEILNGVPFESIITHITRGAQIKASVLDEMVSKKPTNYQYLMLANIQDGIISDDLPFIKEIDKKLEKYCIKNNSLVISKNGTPVKIAVATVPEGQKILGNGNLYVIELDETKVNPYFVKAYLESENGNIALSRIMVGSVIKNIPVDGLKNITIPCPDMKIQNKIAEKYLEKMDEVKVLKYKLSKAITEMKTIYEEG